MNPINQNLELVFQKNPAWPKVKAILDRCLEKKYFSVINGGAVRDALLGITPKDFDIATDARPEQIVSIFKNAKEVGKSFGVIYLPIGNNKGVEIATFRKDGQYLDGRRPSSVEFCDIQQDALRRDFTVNALYYDHRTKQVLDYVNGLADLKNQVIQTVGDPQKRFREDYLRILRAIRFAVTFGFEIESNTLQQMCVLTPKIKEIAKERITDEIDKTFQTKNFLKAVEYFKKTKLLFILWPTWPWKQVEIAWVPHSFQQKSLFFWWVMLFAPSYVKSDSPFKSILKNMNFSNTRIRQIIRFSYFYNEWMNHNTSLGRKWILLHEEYGKDYFDLTVHFQKALKKDTAPLEQVKASYLDKIQKDGWPEPFLKGNDLIQAGISQGPKISELFHKLYEAQLEGHIQSKKQGLEKLKSMKIP